MPASVPEGPPHLFGYPLEANFAIRWRHLRCSGIMNTARTAMINSVGQVVGEDAPAKTGEVSRAHAWGRICSLNPARRVSARRVGDRACPLRAGEPAMVAATRRARCPPRRV